MNELGNWLKTNDKRMIMFQPLNEGHSMNYVDYVKVDPCQLRKRVREALTGLKTLFPEGSFSIEILSSTTNGRELLIFEKNRIYNEEGNLVK